MLGNIVKCFEWSLVRKELYKYREKHGGVYTGVVVSQMSPRRLSVITPRWMISGQPADLP